MTTLAKNGFTFKRFFIAHDKSPMKVTTDSCLLGAWAPVCAKTHTVLDIGCGCGIIGLMLAQRLEQQQYQIDSIDIDQNAVEQCIQNMHNSPFKHLHAECIDAKNYRYDQQNHYDLIVSNPPYFDVAVSCRNEQRQQARYTQSLNHIQLISVAKRLLKAEGFFCVVLPFDLAQQFIQFCLENHLYLHRAMTVNYSQTLPASLSLLCYAKYKTDNPLMQSLCMRDQNGIYTIEFRQLLNEFYLFNKPIYKT